MPHRLVIHTSAVTAQPIHLSPALVCAGDTECVLYVVEGLIDLLRDGLGDGRGNAVPAACCVWVLR